MILSRTLTAAVILALLLVLLLTLRPLMPVDETRYLGVAWELWLTGDLVHLTRNFELYTHKPPLLFWMINLVWSVTGVSEFAARLVGPAFGVAAALAAGRLARRLWPEDPATAPLAMTILAGFSVFLIYASATMLDTMLALATVLGIGTLWRIGSGETGARIWGLFGLILAFGLYGKGPVILVHLGPALILMPLWAPRPPDWRAQLSGAALALGVAAAVLAVWLVPALVGGSSAYREELLWTQTAARVAGGMAHDRPVWFYVLLLPLILFPWGWDRRLWRGMAGDLRRDPAARLLGIWAAGGLILFSFISGKQVHYLMPEFVAVSLLFARAVRRLPDGAARGGLAASLLPALSALAAALAASGRVDLGEAAAVLQPLSHVAWVGLFCFGVAALAWRLPLVAGHAVAGAGLALALHGLFATTGLYARYDSRLVVDQLRGSDHLGIAVFGTTYSAEFNFALRLTQPVATPRTDTEVKVWADAHPGGLILAPVDRAPTPCPPEATIAYNDLTLGFWPAALVTSPGSVPAD